MAEFHLMVPYQPPQARLQLLAVCAALPFWSMVAPALLAVFVAMLSRDPTQVQPLYTFIIISALLGITVGGGVLSSLSEDHLIHVSKHGISFPPFLLPYLRFRRNWTWQELTSASIILDGAKARALIFGFTNNTTLRLDARSMPSSKMEELLLAIELWAPDCRRSPELVRYQSELQNTNKGIDHSHTQMWQEELGRRFTATTFVPLEPGQALRDGKIKVVRQLAFGGLAAIYLVQKGQGELFVLKEAVVPPNADPDARHSAEQHLIREAEILSFLKHPNIALVLDHFVENGRHYLLMEYHLGQDLRVYVRQLGACQESQVREWAIKLAEILRFLHEHDPPIVHRDLTPDNLVLKNDGTLMLIDFGASNEFIGTATGTLIGKQAYMPPEQLRGKATPQSDLYSLGATMFFLLTGRDPVPLSQNSVREVMPELSEEMDALIQALTAFEQQDRMKSAQELATKLNEMAQGRNTVETGGHAK